MGKKPHHLDITDVDKPEDFFMRASVLPRDTVNFSLSTRGFEGVPERPHPDFRAGEFVEVALGHFAGNGFDITKFQASWINEEKKQSVNYDAFMDEFSRTGDIVQAARSTWSGRTLGRHGFTEISSRDISIRLSGHEVNALFHRTLNGQ